jgi:hypothetical protein
MPELQELLDRAMMIRGIPARQYLYEHQDFIVLVGCIMAIIFGLVASWI